MAKRPLEDPSYLHPLDSPCIHCFFRSGNLCFTGQLQWLLYSTTFSLLHSALFIGSGPSFTLSRSSMIECG